MYNYLVIDNSDNSLITSLPCLDSLYFKENLLKEDTTYSVVNLSSMKSFLSFDLKNMSEEISSYTGLGKEDIDYLKKHGHTIDYIISDRSISSVVRSLCSGAKVVSFEESALYSNYYKTKSLLLYRLSKDKSSRIYEATSNRSYVIN